MKRWNEVLLVDDSEGTNALNRRLLAEMGFIDNVTITLNGKIALDYLTTKDESGNYPKPDVILLDIRMPVMDGYQFLDEYHKLNKVDFNIPRVFMLSSSINEIDIERTQKYPAVKGYQFKPLRKESLIQMHSEV